jgi:ESCRT-I complex subunit TSG101
MENTMARERAELDKLANAAIDNEKSLDERMEAAKRAILSAKARPSPDLDDGLSAETAVHNQLYHLVADDHAIDDALYILGKALDSDRIKLDQYMKHTRWLGREQFMKRALVLKISKQLNLIAS